MIFKFPSNLNHSIFLWCKLFSKSYFSSNNLLISTLCCVMTNYASKYGYSFQHLLFSSYSSNVFLFCHKNNGREMFYWKYFQAQKKHVLTCLSFFRSSSSSKLSRITATNKLSRIYKTITNYFLKLALYFSRNTIKYSGKMRVLFM